MFKGCKVIPTILVLSNEAIKVESSGNAEVEYACRREIVAASNARNDVAGEDE